MIICTAVSSECNVITCVPSPTANSGYLGCLISLRFFVDSEHVIYIHSVRSKADINRVVLFSMHTYAETDMHTVMLGWRYSQCNCQSPMWSMLMLRMMISIIFLLFTNSYCGPYDYIWKCSTFQTWSTPNKWTVLRNLIFRLFRKGKDRSAEAIGRYSEKIL